MDSFDVKFVLSIACPSSSYSYFQCVLLMKKSVFEAAAVYKDQLAPRAYLWDALYHLDTRTHLQDAWSGTIGKAKSETTVWSFAERHKMSHMFSCSEWKSQRGFHGRRCCRCRHCHRWPKLVHSQVAQDSHSLIASTKSRPTLAMVCSQFTMMSASLSLGHKELLDFFSWSGLQTSACGGWLLC